MSNLLSNAQKFSGVDKQVILSLTQKHNGYRIAVRDAGRGISKEHRMKIFDSFYQIDALDKPSKLGTGLGLPIAQEIAKAHGGRIRVASKEGAGSVFFFTLPKAEEGQIFAEDMFVSEAA